VATRHFNQNLVVCPWAFVIGRQFLAKNAHLDTDNGIGSWVEAVTALEYRSSNRVFLKAFRSICSRAISGSGVQLPATDPTPMVIQLD
jgi:hypothetical protein